MNLLSASSNVDASESSSSSQQEQIRASRIELISLLAAGTAHGLNNILSTICSNAAVARLQYRSDPDSADELLQQIENSAMAASHLTRQLLSFARTETYVETPLSLPELLLECVEFSVRGSGVRPHFRIDKECPPVLADAAGLRQVISSVVINACQAMSSGGTCFVGLERTTLPPGSTTGLLPGNYAHITIDDTGAGIPSEDLPFVFDSDFTTKRNGKGLGLTVSREIVRQHGGTLVVQSIPGQGTMVSLYLPVYAGVVDTVAPSESLLIRGSGRILLVDDDSAVRGILERAAKVLGYDPVLAEDGEEAVEIYRSAQNVGQRFEVVVLDLIIPGGLGATETLPLLRMLDPAVKVIIATGYNASDVLDDVAEAGFDALLTKPHTLSELSRVLAQTISGSR